jgi:HD-GYP domain-containing protein (c-di-GMP phosphodiesterase class II)
VSDVVSQHHEYLDGSGYPAGLREDEILHEARILTVADVVEAMSSHRPYRPAIAFADVMTDVSGFRGKRYDPDVVLERDSSSSKNMNPTFDYSTIKYDSPPLTETGGVW